MNNPNDADRNGKRDPLMWAMHRSSLVGLVVAGFVIAVWMAEGRVNFGDLFGIALVYAGAIGLA